MSLTKENGKVTIECDKCHRKDTATEANYNQVFGALDWALNKGRKYEHLCFNCLPAKRQKAMLSIKARFGL